MCGFVNLVTIYTIRNDNIKSLLIDEIDKPQRKDQRVLLNLMENNVLIEGHEDKQEGDHM
jgi:MoxR-like ATPase